MDLDDIQKKIQTSIQNHPTIVLGSGASIAHGIRGVEGLADHLRANMSVSGREEVTAWEQIEAELEKGVGLEEALQRSAAPLSLTRKIVRITWEAIAADDLALLQRAAVGEENFPLTSLIKWLFRSTNTHVHIVTTNYDRVAEYATDIARCIHSTGFVPGLIRWKQKIEGVAFGKSQAARIVNVWKVHGSLDWFEDSKGSVISLPLSSDLPTGFLPVIVTPGISKFERTHEEPFRSAIQGADDALGNAPCFLFVGYGFRDSHIQPKVVERCGSSNAPVVILARTLTDEAKQFLRGDAGGSYLAIEESGGGSRVYCNEIPDGTLVPEEQLWSLEGFNNLVF